MSAWNHGWLRWLVLLVGGWSFLIALALALGSTPPVFAAIERVLGVFGARPALAFVGLLAITYALVVVAVVRAADGWRASLPAPEDVPERPQPGGSIDDRFPDDPDHLRERLVALATDVLAEREGISHERAAERIEQGDWPADPAAAAFLASDPPPLSPTALFREWLAPQSVTAERVRRAIDAIEEAQAGDRR